MLQRTASVAEKMDVRVVYKDIAYESLQDDKFLAALKKARLDTQGLRREADAVEADRTHAESTHHP